MSSRPRTRAIQRRLLTTSFREFVAHFWPVVEPSRAFVANVATDALIEHLQAVGDGRIKRLAISIAPGSGKSTMLVLFSAWLWLRRPGARSICASHALDLARRDSQRTRRLIESDEYRAIIGTAWTLRSDANRLDHFENTIGGHRISVGVGGALTGLRAGAGGVIAIDDSLQAIDARSKTTRDAVNDWYDQAVSTRLDQGEGAIVIVQQRLHSDDLIGHVLELGGFESLVLASEFDIARRCVTSVWRDPRTTDGELLAPMIHSAAFLAEQKRVLGTAGFAAQYLASPTDSEGGLFVRTNWRFWKPDGTSTSSRRPRGCTDEPAVSRPAFDRVVISLDAAFKDSAHNDAVAFLVCGVRGAERYLIDGRHGRMSFTRTCEVALELASLYPGATFLVEDKANGSAIVDALRRKIPNLVAINPRESKESRAAAVSPAVEAHQVFLPEGDALWIGILVEEAAQFPKGKNDDLVDALTQLLNYIHTPLDPELAERRATFKSNLGWTISDEQYIDAPARREHALANWDRRQRGETPIDYVLTPSTPVIANAIATSTQAEATEDPWKAFCERNAANQREAARTAPWNPLAMESFFDFSGRRR